MKIINKNSNDLLYFLEKFIEFSQTESSLYTYDYQIFDVTNTIQNVIKNNEAEIYAKSLTVNLDSEGLEKRTICSDEYALKIIIQNLLETAIKLTDIGTITIKTSNPDSTLVEKSGLKVNKSGILKDFIHISLTDTGMGLAESELEGIFEPYSLLDKTSKKLILRSITLGTAANIVKKLRGSIWIESEVMKGSTFNVIIPVEKEVISSNE